MTGRDIWPPLGLAAALLLIWSLAHAVAPSAVVGPEAILARAAQLLTERRFLGDVSETGKAFGAASLLTIALGASIGVLLSLRRSASEIVEPILVNFYAIPKVTLYPIVLLGFGLGLSAKIAFGVMHGIVPVALMTRNAITHLKPVYRRSARVMRIGSLTTVRTILLPAIAPELIAGIRIGLSLTLLGVIIGEMFASKQGIGFAAVTAMGLGDIVTTTAIGMVLALFALVVNVALLSLERRAQ